MLKLNKIDNWGEITKTVSLKFALHLQKIGMKYPVGMQGISTYIYCQTSNT